MAIAPPRMPGLPMMRQAATYPDIRRALPWREWEAGSREAGERSVPILALAEPAWTNAAQRLAHVLGQHDGLRAALTGRVVPVLVDGDARPDLVARWRRAAMTVTGTAGPPMITLLDDTGAPFLTYGTMRYEGDDEYPSLAAVVTAAADLFAADPAAFRAEAASLASRLGAAPGVGDDPGAGDVDARWDRLRERIDVADGGLRELPKHPRPALLWSLLDAHDAGDLPDDLAGWLRVTLHGMDRGGIHDQLDRGFHRCSRDARWVVPHFEKPIPLNAQLAATYARAGASFGDGRLREVGERTAAFALAALGEGVDAIASSSPYYTWEAQEFLRSLSPATMQPMALLYNVVPGEARQVLYRANTPDTMTRYSHATPGELAARTEEGRAELLAARRRRDAPGTVSLSRPEWRAVTIAWLLRAAEWLPGRDAAPVTAALRTLADAPRSPWLADEVALLDALVAAAGVEPAADWEVLARERADRLVATFRVGDRWVDRVGSTDLSCAIDDDVTPATIPVLERCLAQLRIPARGTD